MRRVCVFSGSRADYGSLLPVIRMLHDDDEIDLKLLVTGGHLLPVQGNTVHQIEADGFAVDEAVDMVLASDSPTAVAKSLGLGILGYADALDRIDPDVLVVLGDRYEALAVAVTAALRLLPIAHIAGGEITVGSTDDSVRHAISKLAHLHFTATEEAQQRVIQLGEEPHRVYHTGAPTIDAIKRASLLDRPSLESTLGIALLDTTITVTYHPATADPAASRKGLLALLDALDALSTATVLFTATNVDQGGHGLSNLIREFVEGHRRRAYLFPSLGQLNYLSLVKNSSVVVGNSSSGITEAPALHTPTVNIGSRQQGRPRAESVIDCGETAIEVIEAIECALSPEHQQRARSAVSPYGDGRASQRIVRILKDADIGGLVRKEFFDQKGI